MRTFTITTLKNGVPQDTLSVKAESLEEVLKRDDLESLATMALTVIQKTRSSARFMSRINLKGTDVQLYRNRDGFFFYFSSDGEEIVFDDPSIKWMHESVGAYENWVKNNRKLDIIEIFIKTLNK